MDDVDECQKNQQCGTKNFDHFKKRILLWMSFGLHICCWQGESSTGMRRSEGKWLVVAGPRKWLTRFPRVAQLPSFLFLETGDPPSVRVLLLFRLPKCEMIKMYRTGIHKAQRRRLLQGCTSRMQWGRRKDRHLDNVRDSRRKLF